MQKIFFCNPMIIYVQKEQQLHVIILALFVANVEKN